MKGTLRLFYLRSVTKSKNDVTPSNPYPSAPPVRTTTSSLDSMSKRSHTILRILRSFLTYRWAPEFFFFWLGRYVHYFLFVCLGFDCLYVFIENIYRSCLERGWIS